MAENYNEKCRLTDLLNAEKFATGTYNECLNESSTPELRAVFSSILEEEHKIQNDIFNEMSRRGFYPTKQAEDALVKQAKDKYAASVPCCQG